MQLLFVLTFDVTRVTSSPVYSTQHTLARGWVARGIPACYVDGSGRIRGWMFYRTSLKVANHTPMLRAFINAQASNFNNAVRLRIRFWVLRAVSHP